jgi:hypothetical protein
MKIKTYVKNVMILPLWREDLRRSAIKSNSNYQIHKQQKSSVMKTTKVFNNIGATYRLATIYSTYMYTYTPLLLFLKATEIPMLLKSKIETRD